MSRIDCGAEGGVTCRCDRITGCGHLSSWHRVYERWATKCLVPGCVCASMDACNCVEGLDDTSPLEDAVIAVEMGIVL